MGSGVSSVVTKFVAEDVPKGNKVEAASVYYKALLLGPISKPVIDQAVLFRHKLGTP
jgi:hypothetical protein